jgi:hypothetical protein
VSFLGHKVRYISIDNLMPESLSFSTILTKLTFVTTSVASLMLDSTCFVLGFLLSTFFLAHVLVKCHFEAFVVLSRSSGTFCQNQILRSVKTGQSDFDRLALKLLLLDR